MSSQASPRLLSARRRASYYLSRGRLANGQLGSSAATYAIWGASVGEFVLFASVSLLGVWFIGDTVSQIAGVILSFAVLADMLYAASLPAIRRADAAGLTARGPLWRRRRIAWSDIVEIRRGQPPSPLMGPGGS